MIENQRTERRDASEPGAASPNGDALIQIVAGGTPPEPHLVAMLAALKALSQPADERHHPATNMTPWRAAGLAEATGSTTVGWSSRLAARGHSASTDAASASSWLA